MRPLKRYEPQGGEPENVITGGIGSHKGDTLAHLKYKLHQIHGEVFFLGRTDIAVKDITIVAGSPGFKFQSGQIRVTGPTVAKGPPSYGHFFGAVVPRR